jgi:hypothetical protein
VIARAKSFAERFLNRFKTGHRPPANRFCLVVPLVVCCRTNNRQGSCVNCRSIDRTTGRLMVPPIVRPHDRWCSYLRLEQTGCTTLLQVESHLAFTWSLIVPTGGTITHYWSCDRPNFCDRATMHTSSRLIVCDHLQTYCKIVHCLFILFWVARAIFQLSGDCHCYRWQDYKFRPMFSTYGF